MSPGGLIRGGGSAGSAELADGQRNAANVYELGDDGLRVRVFEYSPSDAPIVAFDESLPLACAASAGTWRGLLRLTGGAASTRCRAVALRWSRRSQIPGDAVDAGFRRKLEPPDLAT